MSYFEFYKAFIAAFFLRTVRNHYIIKNIELIILSNQWTPLVDNFCWLVLISTTIFTFIYSLVLYQHQRIWDAVRFHDKRGMAEVCLNFARGHF